MKQTATSANLRKDRVASTSEAREQQLIAKAERLAEKKLEDGTASPQIIVHYLRLGSEKERLDRKALEADIALKEAKVQSLKSAMEIKDLFEEAMEMFKVYRGDIEEDASDL